MPKCHFDHIHLTSPDHLKTAEFYEKIFGAKRERVLEFPDGRVFVYLTLNGTRIIITKPTEKDPFYGLEHIGLATDDIEEIVAQLKADGINFRDEIQEVQNGIKFAFFRGPDDVLIELIQR